MVAGVPAFIPTGKFAHVRWHANGGAEERCHAAHARLAPPHRSVVLYETGTQEGKGTRE